MNGLNFHKLTNNKNPMRWVFRCHISIQPKEFIRIIIIFKVDRRLISMKFRYKAGVDLFNFPHLYYAE